MVMVVGKIFPLGNTNGQKNPENLPQNMDPQLIIPSEMIRYSRCHLDLEILSLPKETQQLVNRFKRKLKFNKPMLKLYFDN